MGDNIMKKIVIILSLLFVFQTVGAGALFNNNEHKFLFEKNESSNEDTEYWALLVGCNEFVNMLSATLPGNYIAAPLCSH
jgi:sarcosine oxidase delta subunit